MPGQEASLPWPEGIGKTEDGENMALQDGKALPEGKAHGGLELASSGPA